MHLKKYLPYLVAGYIIIVGFFFGVSSLIKGVLLDPEPPGSRYLIAFSIVLIGAGVYSIYLLYRGKLRRAGKSIVEVRKEAIEKLDDPALLAQIALEDENSKVRKAAKKRLNKIK